MTTSWLRRIPADCPLSVPAHSLSSSGVTTLPSLPTRKRNCELNIFLSSSHLLSVEKTVGLKGENADLCTSTLIIYIIWYHQSQKSTQGLSKLFAPFLRFEKKGSSQLPWMTVVVYVQLYQLKWEITGYCFPSATCSTKSSKQLYWQTTHTPEEER